MARSPAVFANQRATVVPAPAVAHLVEPRPNARAATHPVARRWQRNAATRRATLHRHAHEPLAAGIRVALDRQPLAHRGRHTWTEAAEAGRAKRPLGARWWWWIAVLRRVAAHRREHARA